MKQLDKEVACVGVGITDMSATLVKRTKNVCMYARWDNVWEVFHPIIYAKGKVIFDTTYQDDTEIYPSNESFGDTAFCFSQKKYANACYTKMVKKFG